MALEILNEASVPLEELQEDAGNVNVHDEKGLEAIAASLKAFGQVERIVVRKSDGVVYAGNGRLAVMHRLGTKKARVQYVEGTDDECRSYAVAANRTTRLSRFNDADLAVLLSEIKTNDPGLLPATGYSDGDLDKLLKDLEKDAPKDEPETGLDVSKSTPAVTCPGCGKTFAVGGA